MKMSNSVPEPTSTIPVTLEELSAHVSEDDAWTSLGGVVYDVTKYLKHHPGGK
jgi:cytochrome b involved in lipid metabolism